MARYGIRDFPLGCIADPNPNSNHLDRDLHDLNPLEDLDDIFDIADIYSGLEWDNSGYLLSAIGCNNAGVSANADNHHKCEEEEPEYPYSLLDFLDFEDDDHPIPCPPINLEKPFFGFEKPIIGTQVVQETARKSGADKGGIVVLALMAPQLNHGRVKKTTTIQEKFLSKQ